MSEKAFEALRSTSLFAGFSDEQLEMVPKVGHTREFAAGEAVITVGAEANPGLWLVLTGSARVEIEGEVLRVIGPGGHFGEMALLTGAARSADVLAETDLVAMEFTDRHLKGLISSEPEVGIAMLAELARRLRTLTEDHAALIRHSSEEAKAAASATLGKGVILGPIEYALQADAGGS